jgi:hypothetical protein
MRRKLFQWLLLVLAPVAAALFRWPAGAALMALVALLMLWPIIWPLVLAYLPKKPSRGL